MRHVLNSDDFPIWVMVACAMIYTVYTLVTAPVA